MTNKKNEDVVTPDRWDGRQGMMQTLTERFKMSCFGKMQD